MLSKADNIDKLLQHLEFFLDSKSKSGDMFTLGAETEVELDQLQTHLVKVFKVIERQMITLNKLSTKMNTTL